MGTKSRAREVNDSGLLLDRQRKAIIGYPKEVQFFTDKIKNYLKQKSYKDVWYPSWYPSLHEGIFHEIWGLAGMYPWTCLAHSQSAKIIGERIYYMINGRLELQNQRISLNRHQQLRKALLLRTPKARMDDGYTEVYMLDGTRITIYDERKTTKSQPCIIFRRYTVQLYSFEEQARLGTIPLEIIPMLRAMVDMGVNVAFTGAVRTAKTTFLQTWQSYEDESLEGVLVQTDPEIIIEKLMPNAPIISIVADGEDLKNIVKPLLRSDCDYIIMAEARDGIALDIAVRICNKGTRRVKLTYHTTDITDFCYDIAVEIGKIYGGSKSSHMIKVAKSFNYVFQFVQLRDKSKKRLKSIHEVRYDYNNHEISMVKICEYVYREDSWRFKYDIGRHIEAIACEENIEAYSTFSSELELLAEINPIIDPHISKPSYDGL